MAALLRPLLTALGGYVAIFASVGAVTAFALALVPDSAMTDSTLERTSENLRTFFLLEYDQTHQFLPVGTVVRQATVLTLGIVGAAIVLSVGPALMLALVTTLGGRGRGSSVLVQVARAGSTLPVVVWGSLLMLAAFELAGIVPVHGQIADGGGVTVVAALALPVFALALGDGALAGSLERFRDRARSLVSSDAMLAVRARGLSPVRFTLRGMLPDVVDEVASRALLFVSGAIVVEVIFEWQGIGWQILEALRIPGGKDYPLVLACVSVVMLLVLGVHLLRDIVVHLSDPRGRS